MPVVTGALGLLKEGGGGERHSKVRGMFANQRPTEDHTLGRNRKRLVDKHKKKKTRKNKTALCVLVAETLRMIKINRKTGNLSSLYTYRGIKVNINR